MNCACPWSASFPTRTSVLIAALLLSLFLLYRSFPAFLLGFSVVPVGGTSGIVIADRVTMGKLIHIQTVADSYWVRI